MRVLSTLLLLVSSVLALQITSPNNSSGWTTSGPNTVVWQRVDTDPTTFAIFLTNVNGGNPSGVLLNANVDATLSSFVVSAPSGGFSAGSGFRVNFAQDSSHPQSLLAQSDQFTITGGSSSSASTSTSGASTQTGTATGTSAVNTASSSVSSSATSTSPTGTNAAPLRADTPAGFLPAVAAVAALFATLF